MQTGGPLQEFGHQPHVHQVSVLISEVVPRDIQTNKLPALSIEHVAIPPQALSGVESDVSARCASVSCYEGEPAQLVQPEMLQPKA